MSLYDESMADAPTPTGGSLYDESMADHANEGRVRVNVGNALQTTPERAARVKYLSQVTGLPEAVVTTNEGEAQARAKFQEMQQAAAYSPVLRAKLQDPAFVALTQDEPGVLSNVEQTVRKFVNGGGYKKEAAAVAQTLGGMAGQLVGGATVGLGAGVFDAEAVGMDFLSLATKGILPVDVPGQLAASARYNASRARAGLAELLPAPRNSTESGLFSGAQSAGFQLAQLPLVLESAAAHGVKAGAHVMGLLAAFAQGSQTFNEARDAGIGQVGALTTALPAAMAEYVFEKWSGESVLLGIASKSPALKMLLNYGGREVAGEIATTEVQNLNEWLRLNPDKTLKEFIAEQPGAIYQTAVAALVGSGIQVGAIKALQHATDINIKADQAELDAETIKLLLHNAANTKYRERDPQGFADFVQQAADDEHGAPKAVYIDGEKLGEVLNQSGITPEMLAAQLPTAAAQLQDALTANSTVEIPIGELAAAVPGTPLEAALLPHLRSSPDALSQHEATTAREQAQQFLTDQAQRVVQQAADSQKMAASAEAVKQEFVKQLTDVGRFSNDVVDRYSTLMREFYTVMAGRMGITPEQMYQAFPYKVTGEQTALKGKTYSEGARLGALSVEGYHFSPASRPFLTTDAFGTGLQGNSREEYMTAADARLRKRSYFYVDKGTGINPEAGVGGYGHKATLNNVYDADSDPLRLNRGGKLAFESAVLNAGFSGYLNRLEGTQSGQVVMLGKQAPIAVEQLGPTSGKLTGAVVPAPAARPSYGRDLVVDALNANKSLPAGEATRARWSELIAKKMPGEHAAMQAAGVFDGDATEKLYKSDIVKAFTDATPAENYAQTATVRSGEETLVAYGLDPGKKYKTRQVAAALEARQRDKYGAIARDDRSEEAATKIANWMAEEVRFEMQHPRKSGLWWYSKKFQRALDLFGDVFPELKTDKAARSVLTALIAITSDGQKVMPNFRQAIDLYRNYRETGTFSTDIGHMRQASIDGNVAMLQSLLAKYKNPIAMRKYLMQEATVSELRKIAKAAGVDFKTDYMANVKLPMAAVVFGPKLGAFYANLMGASGYLTMDRWWSRTFNRYRGALLMAPTKEGLARFRELSGHPEWSDDETVAAVVAPTQAYAAKGFKDGTEIERAANTIYNAAFENLEDTPFNASDRSFMLNAVAKAQQILAEEGRKISVADIQAVLWYYEKRLYGELGARQTADVSYEDAAKRIVEETNAGAAGGRAALGDGAAQAVDGAGEVSGSTEPGEEEFDPGRKPAELSTYSQSANSASLADFDPANVAHILSKDRWSILTAANPMGQQASEEANAAALDSLRQDLDAIGAEYIDATGKYGNIEPSLVVTNISQDDAVKLGAKYNQDSVLTRDGLVYPDGRKTTPVTGQVDVFTTPPEDYYTTIPSTGAMFAIGLNFEEEAATPTENAHQKAYLAGRQLDSLRPSQRAQYDALSDRANGGKGPLLAPNGKLSNLSPEHHAIVRTEAFKAWFGDWESYAKMEGGVWNDGDKLVSKAVDENGEPLVLYHGADGGGFRAFMTPGGKQRGDIGIFLTPNREMAKSYVKHGRAVDLTREELLALEDGERKAGIYAVFANIRDPLEEDFEGANWDGSRSGLDQFTVLDKDGEIVQSKAGSEFMSEEEARALAEKIGGTFEEAAYHYASTDSVGREAYRNNDGAIIRNVQDDGGGRSNYAGEPSDIFIAFKPTQVKAVDNFGTFDSDNEDILAQKDRGTFNPATLTTVLNEGADLSTFLHETGHFFLEVLNTLSAQPNAPAQLTADMGALLKWFGVKDQATWNAMSVNEKRKHHERFAESFEQYLLEGKAPNTELRSLFRTFRSWLTRVYQSLKAFAGTRKLELSDDVRAVFDRMLATDQQIAEAEKLAGLLPEIDATGEAIEKLQARSLRDLKWAVNARAKAISKLQAEAKTARAEVEAEVTKEVDASPEMQAKAALDKLAVDPAHTAALGEWRATRAAEATRVAEQLKADLLAANPGVKALEKGQLLAKNKRTLANQAEAAMIEWDKAHPQPKRVANANDAEVAVIADSFGFETPEAMLQAIDNFGKRAEVIEGMTDQRMLERHGDLATPEAIAQAAIEAVHNQARAKSLATELSAQREMLNPRKDTGETTKAGAKVTVNAIVDAAKQFAAHVTGKRKVSDLKAAAWMHLQAERRAGKAWEEATKKGDTAAAVQAKQDQMLNNAVVAATEEAQAKVRKASELFRKVLKGSNETVVEKGRDPDVVNVARAILAAYGATTPTSKTAFEYLEVLKANDPSAHAAFESSIQGALAGAKPLTELTVDEMGALVDEIESLWYVAKRSRQMEIGGDLMDVQDAADEVYARLDQIGIPAVVPGDLGALTEREKAHRMLQGATALLRRVEQWAEARDGKFGGPFLRYIFQPVKLAADRYRADRTLYRKEFTALVENVAPVMTPGAIAAPELGGYVFGRGKGAPGVMEITHAILHTGNDSNKRKLLLGRNWATENADGTLDTARWDAFMQRMIDTGVITKAHFDFAQGVWDLLERTKPLAQRAHRTVFGRYFAEVTATPFSNQFGDWRGGYVPAQVDPAIVKDNELRKLAEDANATMAYAFPTTNKGFTKSRVEYNRPLLLDLNTLAQHIDKVLLFAHMEPAVRDVRKLLGSKTVAQPLGRVDPAAISGMLQPWLQRSARQVVETPVVGDAGVSRVLSILRARAGMATMFANVSNTVQQITGLMMAGVKVPPSHLLAATAQYVAHPSKTSKAVANASIFMANRMENEVSALNDTMRDILLNASLYEKSKQWSMQHAYFLQLAFDNVIGPIVWTGGYNHALAQGMSNDDAVLFADGVVRQTQGANHAEDVSRIETGPSYARIFTQFAGYFNMIANTNATALQNIADGVGLRKGAGKALGVVFMGFLAQAWIAEAIAQAFRGGPDDDNKDGHYLDDWLMSVFGMGTVKYALAGVPIIGQFGVAAVNAWNNKPYDDKVSMSPAVSLLEGAVGSPVSVYKAITQDGSKQKAVKDVASLVSMATGLPASALARPLGYLAGVEQHKVVPTSPADAVRGAVTGVASPQSKQ